MTLPVQTAARLGAAVAIDPARPPVTMLDSNASESNDLRTARLLEQLLQIARISALEEMASGIAHELNQPIGAITTFAQAGRRMLDRPDPMIQPAAEVLHHISDEALHAGEGIRRIRNLFNGQDAAYATCELAEVLAELMPLLELLARRRGARLEFVVQPSLPQVSIDRLRIQHVLFTLVQNALEAQSAAEAPKVRIEVTGDRYGTQTIVTDHGPGVREETRQQLFRPFFTTKEQGTGLGLASSRAIVEAHQGTIGFENVAGGGARFWFRLPAAAQEQAS